MKHRKHISTVSCRVYADAPVVGVYRGMQARFYWSPTLASLKRLADCINEFAKAGRATVCALRPIAVNGALGWVATLEEQSR